MHDDIGSSYDSAISLVRAIGTLNRERNDIKKEIVAIRNALKRIARIATISIVFSLVSALIALGALFVALR